MDHYNDPRRLRILSYNCAQRGIIFTYFSAACVRAHTHTHKYTDAGRADAIRDVKALRTVRTDSGGRAPGIPQKPQGLCLRLCICPAYLTRYEGSCLSGAQKVRRAGSFPRRTAAGREKGQHRGDLTDNGWTRRCATLVLLTSLPQSCTKIYYFM